MNPASLILGALPLGVNTVTYNNVSQSFQNQWAEQDRINNQPSMQNTGAQSETKKISGVTLPSNMIEAKATLEALRLLAETAEPQFLFDLDGAIRGKWVVQGFDKEETNGDQTSYTISLKRYPDSSPLSQAKAYIGDNL